MCWSMPARTMTSDGTWYCIGAPAIQVLDYLDDEREYSGGLPVRIKYLTNREWCYHAKCDLIIFGHLFGDVGAVDEEEEDDVGSSSSSKKKEAHYEVTNWPAVLERMEDAHWAFNMKELADHWKEAVVPRLRTVHHCRKNNNNNSNREYNALAGLAAACHNRNVDPADHPHGYGKPLPTASDLYLERVCQEFGGKSAEVIREQERALKQGRQLKKVKRGGDQEYDNGKGRTDDSGDLVMGDNS